MKVIKSIHPEFLEALRAYEQWAFSSNIQEMIHQKFCWPEAKLQSEGNPEKAASLEYLRDIQGTNHSGFPPDMFGLDFNYRNLKESSHIVHAHFFDEIRRMNQEIDQRFQMLLGTYLPALKAYYPPDGYIGWHTNWNAPGYNLIFSFSPNGKGYWRHIDPKTNELVHIDDSKGWHCKAGYFGAKNDPQNIFWHSAYTSEPRLTISYVFRDRYMWEDIVEEIGSV